MEEYEKADLKRREKIENMRSEVGDTLDTFRNVDRHIVLEPYRGVFEDGGEHESPPHRYLFNCFLYQYHLIQVASIICEMLDEILRLERLRSTPRLWTPIQRLFPLNPWSVPHSITDDDDDPDVIQGLRPSSPPKRDAPPSPPSADIEAPNLVPETDLGLPAPRDPDALPPRNLVESFFEFLHAVVAALVTDNAIFAFKAGLLTVVLCLPSLIRSSAWFAYENKFLWAIFLGQQTIARFRGDTIFALTARITSTFIGGLVGLAMWYISSANTHGNPYGIASVCAVCFPIFFFARLYCPIQPILNIFFGITVCLVIGYSYQDQHISTPTPKSPGYGWDIFWRRCLLVVCGAVAAFIASLLPPSTTIRRYQRRLLATTAYELGNIYCGIVGFAGGKGGDTKDSLLVEHVVTALLAVRTKLGRVEKEGTVGKNVGYEFSLRGRWPAERYQRIVDLHVGISYSLSHLISLLEHLDPKWSRAFLRRTRFMDPNFQGDTLAVISMITSSLRSGTPLPQITPCPLLDRFMLKYHGLDIIHHDAEEDYGLPRTLSMDVLRDEEYLMFSVGISTAFGLVNRLDRLMMAVKEVVGEHYHIHGVGVMSLPGVVDGGPSAREHGSVGHTYTSSVEDCAGVYPKSMNSMDRDHDYEREKKRSLGMHFDDVRV